MKLEQTWHILLTCTVIFLDMEGVHLTMTARRTLKIYCSSCVLMPLPFHYGSSPSRILESSGMVLGRLDNMRQNLAGGLSHVTRADLKLFGFLVIWTDCRDRAPLGKISGPPEFEMKNNYLKILPLSKKNTSHFIKVI